MNRTELVADMSVKLKLLPEEDRNQIREKMLEYAERADSSCDDDFIIDEYLDDVCNPERSVKSFESAKEIYDTMYKDGEYCHEQSFLWGWQEGIDWLVHRLNLDNF